MCLCEGVFWKATCLLRWDLVLKVQQGFEHLVEFRSSKFQPTIGFPSRFDVFKLKPSSEQFVGVVNRHVSPQAEQD